MISSKMKKRMNRLKQALARPRNSPAFHADGNSDGAEACFKLVIGRPGSVLRILAQWICNEIFQDVDS